MKFDIFVLEPIFLYLFFSSQKQHELNKHKEVIVLDPKRSNAINIAMTKLPPPRSIRTAILKMDSTVVNREGIEVSGESFPEEEEEKEESHFSPPPPHFVKHFLLEDTPNTLIGVGRHLKCNPFNSLGPNRLQSRWYSRWLTWCSVRNSSFSLIKPIARFDQLTIFLFQKLLSMLPTDEEKCKILEAVSANPGVPLGSAENFLLELSNINELVARLKLWAFKLDYENLEREVAEPLMDLKQGMDILRRNPTFKAILSTLLSIGE